MATTPHQLLKLLLLLLFVVNLSSCCDISAARRDVQSGSGQFQKLNPKAGLAKTVARRAAKGVKVKLEKIEEAYYSVSQ